MKNNSEQKVKIPTNQYQNIQRMKNFTLLFLLNLLSTNLLLAQSGNAILFGIESRTTTSTFIKGEFDLRLTDDSKLAFTMGFSPGEPQTYRLGPKKSTVNIKGPVGEVIYHNTLPYISSLAIGYKRYLSENEYLDIYCLPEITLLYRGTSVSTKMQQIKIGEETSGGGWELFGSSTTYNVVERTTFVRNVPTTLAFNGCLVLGIEFRFWNILLDLSGCLIVDPSGYWPQLDRDYVSGYKPAKIQGSARAMIGYQF